MSRHLGLVAFSLAWIGIAAGCTTVENLTGIGGASPLDSNDDGVVSAQEAEQDPSLAGVFEQVDTNRDDNINPAELRAAQLTIADVDFDGLDFNGDGVISEREAAAVRPSLRERFGDVDADDDNNVSKAEYEAARLNLLSRTEFAAFDTDSDGVIDEAEAEANQTVEKNFSALDIDDDGLISDEEFKRVQKQ